jgi:hypothetical protein
MCLVMCLGQAIEQSGKKERPVADLHPLATHTLGMLNIAPTQLDVETREETTLKPYFLELCGMYSHYFQLHLGFFTCFTFPQPTKTHF